MPERTLIVGDVHGCLEELEALLDVVAFEPGEDALVSVGDLVGKGPHGAEVVRLFREGGHRAVRGNHEDRLLRWHHGESKKKLRGMHLVHAVALSDDDWAWLDALPLWIRLDAYGVTVLHAGRLPEVPLEAHEPAWLMSMRTIAADGAPSKRLEDGPLWAASWGGPDEVVFGHDAISGLQRWPHAIGLDTGCVYGGALSAYVLPEREVVSVQARATYEEPGG